LRKNISKEIRFFQKSDFFEPIFLKVVVAHRGSPKKGLGEPKYLKTCASVLTAFLNGNVLDENRSIKIKEF
jgi:hypothetical protein